MDKDTLSDAERVAERLRATSARQRDAMREVQAALAERDRAVARLDAALLAARGEGILARDLEEAVGVSRATLDRWLRRIRQAGDLSGQK